VRDKQLNDGNDIRELLKAAVKTSCGVQNETWMPSWFINDATNGAALYVQTAPESATDWKKIGLGIL